MPACVDLISYLISSNVSTQGSYEIMCVSIGIRPSVLDVVWAAPAITLGRFGILVKNKDGGTWLCRQER